MDKERIERWRLILGKQADPENGVPLKGDARGMDKVLEALYDSDRSGGLGSSSPNINRWLGDIRTYFPTPVVQLMQRDALHRLGLERMLMEPELLETLEPDVELAITLLSLSKAIPDKTKSTARMVVRKVAEQLEKRLEFPLKQAIRGSLNRATRNPRPRLQEINWNRTILSNLKHYQPEYKTIIPEQLQGYGRKRHQLKEVIILSDQSGSMASSVVYAGILSCIMASIGSIRTHFVAFDTSVADLSSYLQDPVDLLFATQLGGGTDIARAIAYAQQLIRQPRDTVIVLISDLYEGGREADLLRRAAQLKSDGATLVALLALNDQGAPAFSKGMAEKFAALGIPSFACTPEQFPPLMAAALSGQPIPEWAAQKGIHLAG
ncbi:VWA domain-containing protein [Phaeodactylibacter luteus]|uniref:VWA domain-containing protein n=1 Tax=Phaeodactylibacter luteus TaxID=1564516 RepID=A0A5C6RKJ5_9BACT|nr:VWA domain-containing protein [Phaeodactylibacter luteus]TXB62429.1 VWA domain-containing protein [Phaeodactylibacter luteus]